MLRRSHCHQGGAAARVSTRKAGYAAGTDVLSSRIFLYGYSSDTVQGLVVGSGR